jgi:hypothetical protein
MSVGGIQRFIMYRIVGFTACCLISQSMAGMIMAMGKGHGQGFPVMGMIMAGEGLVADRTFCL